MAEKIAVDSGNPYRGVGGKFGTSPDQKLADSFKKLAATKLVSPEDNEKKIKSLKGDAEAKLAELRSGDKGSNTNSGFPDSLDSFNKFGNLRKNDPDFYRADPLERVTEQLGYNGLPNQVDSIPADATTLHRAWGQQSYIDEYSTIDKPRLSIGIHGSGLYFSNDEKAAKTSAESRNVVMSQAYISKDAKGITSSEIGGKMFDSNDKWQAEISKALDETKKIKDKADRASAVQKINNLKGNVDAIHRDAGIFAALHGYDYIYTEKGDGGAVDDNSQEFVLLNRSKLNMLKAAK